MAGYNKKPSPAASVSALQSFHASHPQQQTTRLNHLLLVLFTLTALLGAYFSYRPTLKSRNNKWSWTFDTGRSGAVSHSLPVPLERASSCDDSIEGKINDLAKAFGISPKELASAIAVAVKNHVPSESGSSLVSKETSPTIVPSSSVYERSADLVGEDDPPLLH